PIQAWRAFLPPRILDADAGLMIEAQLDDRKGHLEHVVVAGPHIFVGINPLGDDQIAQDNLSAALLNSVAVAFLVLMQADDRFWNAQRIEGDHGHWQMQKELRMSGGIDPAGNLGRAQGGVAWWQTLFDRSLRGAALRHPGSFLYRPLCFQNIVDKPEVMVL